MRGGGVEESQVRVNNAHTGGHCDRKTGCYENVCEKSPFFPFRQVFRGRNWNERSEKGHNNKVSREQRRDRDRKDAFSTFPCF